MTSRSQVVGAVCGLTAAVLFGLSAPLAKLLLPSAGPLVLAALLYLGGGAAVLVFGLLARKRSEAKLSRKDAPWLVGIIFSGGMAGPALMLFGLQRLTGSTASLLLNLEGPLTILLAVTVFGEHLSRRSLLPVALIFGAAALLTVSPGQLRPDALGIASLGAACLCWALDNNFTQRLSLKSPVAVVRIKALAAGAGMLVASFLTRQQLPELRFVAGALVLGAFSYGFSILLDMYALRYVGAAREAAYFATAPFIGALAAVPLLGERVTLELLGAGGLMAVGVALLVRERHGHLHTHGPMEHEHVHVHDEHHQHAHEGPVTEPHSHPHTHAPLTHDHPHVSDLHHRHKH